MKTNHRRNFKDPGSFKDPSMMVRCKRLSNRIVKASLGNDFARGKHGAARSKHGLKQYLRVRERIDGKNQCKAELYDTDL
jgi:hypothetical protein